MTAGRRPSGRFAEGEVPFDWFVVNGLEAVAVASFKLRLPLE